MKGEKMSTNLWARPLVKPLNKLAPVETGRKDRKIGVREKERINPQCMLICPFPGPLGSAAASSASTKRDHTIAYRWGQGGSQTSLSLSPPPSRGGGDLGGGGE